MFAAFSSVKSWLAVSVWLPIELAVVFQLNVSVVEAPAARPGTLCGAMVTLSGASWSVTLKLALTASVPTFLTVTPTFTVAPCVTAPGALMLEIAMSEASGGGGALPSTCTPK